MEYYQLLLIVATLFTAFFILIRRLFKKVPTLRKYTIISSPRSIAYLGSLWLTMPVVMMFIGVLLFNKMYYLLLLLFVPLLVGFYLFIKAASNTTNIAFLLEKIAKFFLFCVSMISVLITVAILFFLIQKTSIFFDTVDPKDFFFKFHWSPHTYELDPRNSFGVLPVFFGSFCIALISIVIAVPLGLMIAIYITYYSGTMVRRLMRPVLELLSGIPTIVYGYFAAFVFAPFFLRLSEVVGISISTESAFVAGIVIGIMMIPYLTTLYIDAFDSIPKFLKDSSLSLGSTKYEMIKNVLIPYRIPSIIVGISLGFSRAIGETMIVVMSASLVAKETLNPFDSMTTATVQIVALLTGDQEFNSPKTLVAFAIGLTLFVMTLCINFVSIILSKKFDKSRVI